MLISASCFQLIQVFILRLANLLLAYIVNVQTQETVKGQIVRYEAKIELPKMLKYSLCLVRCVT